MREIIFGIVSAFIAYGFNRILMKWQKDKSIVWTIPLVEEISKTGIAILSNSGIIGVHIVFGMIEALYDIIHTKERKVAVIAAILSLISHSIFGVASYYLYYWTRWLPLTIMIVAAIHSIWNYFITH